MSHYPPGCCVNCNVPYNQCIIAPCKIKKKLGIDTLYLYSRKKMTYIFTPHAYSLAFNCVVPENIHTPPTEGIFPMTPPPLWIFQKLTLKTDPPSPPEIPFLSHTPWKYYHSLWKPKIRYFFSVQNTEF